MFRECKKHCDILVVGLHVDPTIDRPEKNKPIQSVYERYLQLRGCKYVDEIIPYETEDDLINILAIEPIAARFVGTDYIGKVITGQDICDKLDIRVIYTPRYHSYSSSALRNKLEMKHD